MPDYLVDKKFTQDQADRMMAPLELDLMALFKIIENDMIDLPENYKGTPERFIKELKSYLSISGGKINKSLNNKLEGNMPKVKPEESEKEYVARCIPIVMREGATRDQAAGKCFGMYRNAQKAKDDRPPKQWWDNTVSALRQKKEIDDPEALAGWIWYHHKQESKKAIYKKGKETKTVEGYVSPPPGNISDKEINILARVYAEMRKKGYDKARSAKIAWGAIKRYRSRKTKKSMMYGLANKVLKGLSKKING